MKWLRLALPLSVNECFHVTERSVRITVSESCAWSIEADSVKTCFDIGPGRVLREVWCSHVGPARTMRVADHRAGVETGGLDPSSSY